MNQTLCPSCSYYFLDWRSHGPDFPFEDWEVVEKREIQVGTHAPVDVFEGTARCKKCGRLSEFFCTYGEGYGFKS